jgi:AcrR family transcriptional regulator
MKKYEQILPTLTPKTQKTYNKIIKCAKKEFANRGYSNTSIHFIAKKAGLSVGCLYKYFSSKDELYNFIITSEQNRIKEFLNESIRKCSSQSEKEKEGLRAWLTYVRNNPGVYKLIWETLFIDPKAFDDYYKNFASSYAYALKRSGEISQNDNLMDLSYALIGISNFLGIRLINPKNKITDEEIDRMVETGYHLIKNGIFSK